MTDDKIYFMPGDVVTLKQNIPNAPIMIVVKKETLTYKHLPSVSKDSILRGIKCRWFSTEGSLQEAIFNTKDLVKYEI